MLIYKEADNEKNNCFIDYCYAVSHFCKINDDKSVTLFDAKEKIYPMKRNKKTNHEIHH
jgi:hypothetical protein